MSIQYRIIILGLCSLLSFGSIAGESYTCKLDAKKTKGWIPSTIEISFDDDKQLTRLWSADYSDYDIAIAKILRYTKDFREIKYIGTYPTEGGGNYRTIHTITIMPKLNNKISYMMKFPAYSNHYNARGQCKRTELKQEKTKTSAACPVDMKMCASSFVCINATYDISGKWEWHQSNSASYKYVTEAKKRGLSCGVSKPTKSVSKTSAKPNWKNTQVTKQTRLAINLLSGYGVPVDKSKALKLLLLSAKEQDARALFSLGKMYRDGDGVLKNYKRAFMWFSLAVFNGYHAQAGANAMNEIEGLLDARSLIEAQDLSSQCVEQSYKDC